jgi:hypothetical protein
MNSVVTHSATYEHHQLPTNIFHAAELQVLTAVGM